MQETRVLNYLREHEGITAREAVEELDVTRLSAVIFKLRERGYHIVSVKKTYRNKYNEQSYITQYRLFEEEESRDE